VRKVIAIGVSALLLVFLLTGCTSGASPSTQTQDNGQATSSGQSDSATSNATDNAADNTAQTGSYSTITAEEAKQMMDSGQPYILLDVRTEQEYQQQRIDGATLIPLNELSARAATELPDKDIAIIVYCRSGARSSSAAQMLASMGYTNVHDLGGISNWPYGTVSG